MWGSFNTLLNNSNNGNNNITLQTGGPVSLTYMAQLAWGYHCVVEAIGSATKAVYSLETGQLTPNANVYLGRMDTSGSVSANFPTAGIGGVYIGDQFDTQLIGAQLGYNVALGYGLAAGWGYGVTIGALTKNHGTGNIVIGYGSQVTEGAASNVVIGDSIVLG